MRNSGEKARDERFCARKRQEEAKRRLLTHEEEETFRSTRPFALKRRQMKCMRILANIFI